MTDTTCATHAPQHATPATRSAPRFVSMSLHVADVLIVLANPSAPAASGQPQGTCHAAQTEAGQAGPPRKGGNASRNGGEMFQERIRIRRAEPEYAIGRIARRSRNVCGTRPDGRQRTRVVMTINRVQRNTREKRCKSVTS
ncbi:hypothetical protein [Burkholderia sp. BCC1644]|uniref:hypothetical protein n=1 Tax=Burkholderia sp. BCC1644 TaxID=2676293 RepID=UPI0015913702|nr:hypothetical protein [Burkholderia sp. BCC1644]